MALPSDAPSGEVCAVEVQESLCQMPLSQDLDTLLWDYNLGDVQVAIKSENASEHADLFGKENGDAASTTSSQLSLFEEDRNCDLISTRGSNDGEVSKHRIDDAASFDLPHCKGSNPPIESCSKPLQVHELLANISQSQAKIEQRIQNLECMLRDTVCEKAQPVGIAEIMCKLEQKLDAITSSVKNVESKLGSPSSVKPDDRRPADAAAADDADIRSEDRKRLKARIKEYIELQHTRHDRQSRADSPGGGWWSYKAWLDYMFGIRDPDPRTGKLGSRLIHPTSRFMIGMIMCSFVFLAYTAAVAPVQVCLYQYDDPCAMFPTLYFDVVVDSFFLLEVAMQFVVGAYDQDGSYNDDIAFVAYQYLTTPTSFWFDIVTSIPFSYIDLAIISNCDSVGGSQSGQLAGARTLRAVKIMRIVKLIRLLKFAKFCLVIADYAIYYLGVVSYKIIRLLVTAITVVHLFACLFWKVKVESSDAHHVAEFLSNRDVSPNDLSQIYLLCFYFVFTVFTTVGFGDISAQTPGERVYCVFLFLSGASLFATLISQLNEIIQDIARATQELDRKLGSYLSIEPRLGISELRKILGWVKFQFNASQADQQNREVIDKSNLPACLRREVARKVENNLFSKILFLKGTHSIHDILSLFAAELFLKSKQLYFPEGCVIADSRDEAEGLMVITTGSVSVEVPLDSDEGDVERDKTRNVLVVLGKGDSIGDNVIVGDKRWAGTMGVRADFIAKTNCAITFIQREDIEEILRKFEFFPIACKIQRARLNSAGDVARWNTIAEGDGNADFDNSERHEHASCLLGEATKARKRYSVSEVISLGHEISKKPTMERYISKSHRMGPKETFFWIQLARHVANDCKLKHDSQGSTLLSLDSSEYVDERSFRMDKVNLKKKDTLHAHHAANRKGSITRKQKDIARAQLNACCKLFNPDVQFRFLLTDEVRRAEEELSLKVPAIEARARTMMETYCANLAGTVSFYEFQQIVWSLISAPQSRGRGDEGAKRYLDDNDLPEEQPRASAAATQHRSGASDDDVQPAQRPSEDSVRSRVGTTLRPISMGTSSAVVRELFEAYAGDPPGTMSADDVLQFLRHVELARRLRPTLTDEEREQILAACLIFDEDSDGRLNCEELIEALESVGVSHPPGRIEEVAARVSAEFAERGTIAFGDVEACVRRLGLTEQLRPTMTERHLRDVQDAFDLFDTDGNETLHVTELKAALFAMGFEPTHVEAEVAQLLRRFDTDNSEELDYGEFEEFMRSIALSSGGVAVQARRVFDHIRGAWDAQQQLAGRHGHRDGGDANAEADGEQPGPPGPRVRGETLTKEMVALACRQARLSVSEEELNCMLRPFPDQRVTCLNLYRIMRQTCWY